MLCLALSWGLVGEASVYTSLLSSIIPSNFQLLLAAPTSAQQNPPPVWEVTCPQQMSSCSWDTWCVSSLRDCSSTLPIAWNLKTITTYVLFSFIYNYCLSLLRLPKYHRLRGSNNRNVLLTVLEAGKLKIKCRQGQFHPLLLACRWPPSYVLTWPLLICTEKGGFGVPSSSFKDTNLIMEAPLSWFHLNLITSQRSHFQTPSLWGGFNIWIWGGRKHSAPNSSSNKRRYLKPAALSWPDMDISMVEFLI